ncbi:hypothetical protein Cni_G16926 [Canna indica]|uniref:Late embryogenesis abundant protein LEA-2 subgroup domain-containing protein n=1 Tax=Canna indica TaxID=4628 RepID=A0AAQ3QEM5_9LILI|nr:hypothetical protein Cni_G16926 [Canna indica]
MADPVYLSSKPSGAAPLPYPPSKSQINGATRLAYRPQPPKRRSGRGLCCSCCLFFILLLVVLIVLAAIAGGVFYAVYRPRLPAFSVSTLRLAALNVSTSGHLTSRLDLNVTARNPNKKLVYLYDPISFSVLSSGGVGIGDGSFAAFVNDAGSSTLLSASASSSGQKLESGAASELRKSKSLAVEVEMETKAGVKVGGLKTKKMRIKVRCEGISVVMPKGKAAAIASPVGECKVKLHIKIWKWTL